MEVNNQMMDQLLVNTAAQTPANPGVKAPKDADRPDFDSMVSQKRSETSEPKTAKTAEKPSGKPEAAKTETEVADEQYAIAAAMMYQAQAMAIQPELVAAENEVTVSAVLTVDAESQTGLPEAEIELPAEPELQLPVELAADAPETAEAAEEAVPTAENTGRETPVAPRREEADRPAIEAEAEPETEHPEQRVERTARPIETEAPREEKTPEAPRIVRGETRVESGDDADTDAAQAAQEAPLFERVEAPVIKVAEASKPIPLEAENGIEQLGEEIDGVLVNSVDANRIEVTLTPENLGKLTVEITRGTDGTLNVVLHTTTEKAANLLEKSVDGLRQALASNASREVEVQVRGSEETQQQFLNPDGQNEQNRQQQQQRRGRRSEQRSAQDFLQQLRLGLVDVEGVEE